MSEGPKNYEVTPEIERHQEFDPDTLIKPELIEKVGNAVQKDFSNTWDLSHYCEHPNGRNEFVTKLRQIFANDQKGLRQLEQVISEEKKRLIRISEANEGVTPLPVILDRWKGFGREAEVRSLYAIASCLKRALLDEQDPITDIRNILHGKKILILGDDNGTLSEMLRFYGAESYGIDNDKYNLLVARSGLLSENGRPQNQVIEGDISELFEPEEGQLMQTVKTFGPFDVIFSHGVFVSQAGLDASLMRRFNLEYESADIEDVHIQAFQDHCKQLNADNGFQLYLTVDMYWIFPEKYRGVLGGLNPNTYKGKLAKFFMIPKKEGE